MDDTVPGLPDKVLLRPPIFKKKNAFMQTLRDRSEMLLLCHKEVRVIKVNYMVNELNMLSCFGTYGCRIEEA